MPISYDQKLNVTAIKIAALMATTTTAAGLPIVYTRLRAWIYNHSTALFISLFLFRYIRAVINAAAAHIFYKPVPISSMPLFEPQDVSVIIVTTDLMHKGIHDAIESIIWHPVRNVVIAAGGNRIRSQEAEFKRKYPDQRVQICPYHGSANVRQQAALAIRNLRTKLFVKQDDHSYWPENKSFLPSLLARFEQDKVVAVGSILKTKHHHYPISFRGFWNFIGMAYLTARKREFIASDCIDGGIPCLEGRFGVFRTSSFNTDEFLEPFLNDYHVQWFGYGKRIGPLNVDDDKFVTRYIREKGKGIKIQGGPDSIMETELGEWPRYGEQIMRWSRTTWRSNTKEITTQKALWCKFPWSFYANLIYSFGKSSLFHDVALFGLLHMILDRKGERENFCVYAVPLAVWIYGIRLAKVCFGGAIASRKELVYLPGFVVWVYIVSLIRIYALFTCGNMGWGTEANASLHTKAGDLVETANSQDRENEEEKQKRG